MKLYEEKGRIEDEIRLNDVKKDRADATLDESSITEVSSVSHRSVRRKAPTEDALWQMLNVQRKALEQAL